MQITGIIEEIEKERAIPTRDGQDVFRRREFVLDCARYNPQTGEKYPNFPKFELSGDKCAMLDAFRVGQRVTVDYSLRGVRYQGNDGLTKYFTSLAAYKITPEGENAPTQKSETAAPKQSINDDLLF